MQVLHVHIPDNENLMRAAILSNKYGTEIIDIVNNYLGTYHNNAVILLRSIHGSVISGTSL